MKDAITGISVKGDNFYIDGKKTRLAGNHTWNNVQPVGGKTVGMDKVTGNFTRLWVIEQKSANFSNSPWGSTVNGYQDIENGPWKKGGELNLNYYKALEETVKAADKKGIVVGVMFFEGAMVRFFDGWNSHPFNPRHMKNGPSDPSKVHTRGWWNKYQRAHVKMVTKTLEKYDNVIYEVGNEMHRNSTKWFQGKVIEWVNEFTDKPVGASYSTGMKPSKGRTQDWLTKIGADWIAPSGSAKLANFKGPQVLDTDHAWPLFSNVAGLRSTWNDNRSIWLMDGFAGNILRNQESLNPDRAFIDSVV